MYFAIGSILVFGTILTISHYDNLDESLKKINFDKDKQLVKLHLNDSLLLMKEKFPNLEIIEHENSHEAQIEAIARNSETQNYIRLNISHHWNSDETHESVRCKLDNSKFRDQFGVSDEYEKKFENSEINYPLSLLKDGRAEKQYVFGFIMYTNCLEINGNEEPQPKISSPEYGDIPTYVISIPQGSSVPGCEELAKCFLPEEITIKKGEIIEWKNYDDANHTVTSGNPDDGPTPFFDSGLAAANATFALKFDSIGTFDYFCMVHPWQTGTITVIN